MRNPAWWPLTRKKTAQALIDAEYQRATIDGQAKVHRWAVEANYNVYTHARPELAARAAFQEAEHMFAPDRITI